MKYIVIILLFLLNYANYSQADIPLHPLENKTLPDTFFYNAQGDKLILDQFSGKIVILNFWATWCTNCVKEMKILDEMQKKFMKLPIKIIPLAVDFKDLESIENYYKVNNIKFLSIYKDEKRSLYSEFSSHGMPISVVINEKGEILGYFKGNVDWNNEEIHTWLISLTKDIKFEYKEDEEAQQILEKKVQ